MDFLRNSLYLGTGNELEKHRSYRGLVEWGAFFVLFFLSAKIAYFDHMYTRKVVKIFTTTIITHVKH